MPIQGQLYLAIRMEGVQSQLNALHTDKINLKFEFRMAFHNYSMQRR